MTQGEATIIRMEPHDHREVTSNLITQNYTKIHMQEHPMPPETHKFMARVGHMYISPKILSVTASKIEVEFFRNGLWRLSKLFKCEVYTDEGVLRFYADAGFITDMRSGSDAINAIIPKFTGNNIYNSAILVHDMNYTVLPNQEHLVSKDLADDLLANMAIYSGEIGKVKAGIMKCAVKLAGDSAYYAPDEPPYNENGKMISLKWSAR